MDILEKRPALENAIWLWLLLNRHASMKASEKWWSVNSGTGYNDETLAAALNVSSATARKWRVRLERAGLIRSFPGTPRKRSFAILNITWKENDKPAAELLPDDIGTSKAGEVLQ